MGIWLKQKDQNQKIQTFDQIKYILAPLPPTKVTTGKRKLECNIPTWIKNRQARDFPGDPVAKTALPV